MVTAALALAGACAAPEPDGEIPGQVTVPDTGDLSHPPVDRSSTIASESALCGPDVLTAPVVRAPYLQQVTNHSALVAFTVAAGSPVPEVILKSAAGEEIRRVPTAIDVSAHPVNATQVIARLENLPPITSHCYEVWSGGVRVAGPYRLRTAPLPGPDPVRFIAFGDSGNGSPDQRSVKQQMLGLPADLLIHTGDVAYDSGTPDEFERNVFDVYKDIFPRVPFYPSVGNHDAITNGAMPYFEDFVLPENGATAGADAAERFYSFDWGSVHVVALDTEQTNARQADWLDTNLAANKLPWTVVFAHKPPFSSGWHGSDADFRTHFVPVLERHHVALVLSGHEHNYERVLPQNGVTYVVSGGGGRGVRPVGRSSFTAFSAPVLHVVQVTITGDHLALHAIDATGREFDGAVIDRAPTPANVP